MFQLLMNWGGGGEVESIPGYLSNAIQTSRMSAEMQFL